MQALFQGMDEIQMINKIFEVLGTPNDNIWPGYSNLPYVSVINIIQYPAQDDLRDTFGISKDLLDDEGYNLMMRMLHYDPEQRIIASDALMHPYL